MNRFFQDGWANINLPTLGHIRYSTQQQHLVAQPGVDTVEVQIRRVVHRDVDTMAEIRPSVSGPERETTDESIK